MLSHTTLLKKDGAWRTQLQRQCNQGQERRQQNERQQRDSQVQNALEEEMNESFSPSKIDQWNIRASLA
jgi:hypothetical protein